MQLGGVGLTLGLSLLFMFRDRVKRVSVSDVQPETVLDLLRFLPRRLLESIVKEYGLTPVNKSKDAMIFIIAEHRKTIFKTLKFTLSYADRNNDGE
jgi:hypothetical protein